METAFQVASFFGFGSLVFGIVLMSEVYGVMGIRVAILMFMVGVMHTAGFPLVIGDLKSNFGNLFYAGVMFASAVGALRDGERTATKNVLLVLKFLVAITLLFAIVRFYPTNVSESFAKSLDERPRILTASFLAFVFSNAVCVRITCTTKRPIVAQILGQAIDSLIFFPLAFFGKPVPVLSMMISGFFLKAGLALWTWPFLLVRARMNADKAKL